VHPLRDGRGAPRIVGPEQEEDVRIEIPQGPVEVHRRRQVVVAVAVAVAVAVVAAARAVRRPSFRRGRRPEYRREGGVPAIALRAGPYLRSQR